MHGPAFADAFIRENPWLAFLPVQVDQRPGTSDALHQRTPAAGTARRLGVPFNVFLNSYQQKVDKQITRGLQLITPEFSPVLCGISKADFRFTG